MSINTNQLHQQATDAVVLALQKLYESDDSGPDPDAMRGFAEAIAQIAVVTAEHIVARAETVPSGDTIR